MDAAAKLEMILTHLANGRTVYLATALRVTKITPKVAAKFAAISRPVVKLSKNGASLLLSEGRSYVCADYCAIKVGA